MENFPCINEIERNMDALSRSWFGESDCPSAWACLFES